MAIWRKVTWRHLALAAALSLTIYFDSGELYSTLHRPTRVTGIIRGKDGSPIESVDVALFPKDTHDYDVFCCAATLADGSYSVEREAGKGIVLTLQVTHRAFQPYITKVVADRQEHEMQITLERQPEWKPVQFKSGDRAEFWTGTDWCDAAILRVGEKDSPTPDGAQDMRGKYYIRVNPVHTSDAKFWESADNLRPKGLRGARKCLDE